MFANVNTRILDVANTAADLAIVDSGGKAGVVIFGNFNYAMAIGKAKMMEAEIKKCGGCTVLSLEDSPMTEASLRMPQLTTSLLQRYGDKWTYSLAVNDLYYDFMGPSLASAGKSRRPTRRTTSRRETDRNRRSREFAPSSSRWPPCRSRCMSRAGS